MPTVPHQARDLAESFGADAQRYDRARPGYPAELVRSVVAAAPGRDFLDVGIGTGIAARQFEDAGCTVLGVEVDARMAELARRRGFAVEVARFEQWDPAGRAFDAVVSGQTWHWIDPVAGAAKAAQALRPGGRLAVFWNVMQPPPELARAFAAIYRELVPDLPFDPWGKPVLDLYEPILAKAVEGLRGPFGEPEQGRFDWVRHYTRAEWLDQIPTFGGFSRFPPDTQSALLTAVAAAVGDGFTMAYATVALTAARAE